MNRRTSIVWNFCSVVDEKKQIAKCNMCKTLISYKTTVSNLKKHLLRKHPTVQLLDGENVHKGHDKTRENIAEDDSPMVEVPDNNIIPLQVHSTPTTSTCTSITSKTTTQTKISSFVPKKITAGSKKKIDAALSMLFYKDLQPFKVVEDEGFRHYTNALNPSYEIPSRQVLSRTFIPSLYEQCLVDCKELAKNFRAVSLTTDCWTSAENDSYMAITVHFVDENYVHKTMLLTCSTFNVQHTSANLANELKTVAKEWGIEKKIVLAVSDNASNITSAIKNGTDWKFFGCYAHTINLVVQDALNVQPEVIEVVRKVKTVVSHFKRSSKATTKLITFQENAGKVPKKLIQDVVTRWNSTYYMIERFTELEEAIRSTVAILDIALPQITTDEWRILKDLKIILEPFEDATRVISGQKYLVSSLVIVITGGLLDVCQELSRMKMTPSGSAVITKLRNGLQNRLGNVEYSNTLAITTFLDPRFKLLPFKNSDAAERVKKNTIAELAEIISKNVQQTDSEKSKSANTPSDPPKQVKKISIWSAIDKIAAEDVSKHPVKTSTSKAIIEVQRYLEDDLLDRKKDPLQWWREHQYIYPQLSQLVRNKLCAVATSVPCESLFSKAGQIISERRRSLKPKKVQMLLFLNCNSKFVSQ